MNLISLSGSSEPMRKSSEKRPSGNGAPGEIRTPDLQLRRLPLYPAELRAHCCVSVHGGFHRIKRGLFPGKKDGDSVGVRVLRLSELPRAELRLSMTTDQYETINAVLTITDFVFLSACSSSLAKKNQVEGPLPYPCTRLPPTSLRYIGWSVFEKSALAMGHRFSTL